MPQVKVKSSNLRNSEQNAKLHALIGQLKIDKEVKAELVYQFTNGRETSSAKMTVNECRSLIEHLQGFLNKESFARCDKMRKRILSMAHEMGWELEGGKVDIAHVNEFCRTKGYLHKGLDQYTYQELPKLIFQFEQVYEHYLKSI